MTLVAKLANLRSQLSQASDTVDAVHERAAEIAAGEPRDERIEQGVQLALRVVATLSEVDASLGESADRLTETQTKGQQLKSNTRFYIRAARISAVLLIAWMAAGQVCLCLFGWNGLRQSRVQPS